MQVERLRGRQVQLRTDFPPAWHGNPYGACPPELARFAAGKRKTHRNGTL